MPICLDNGPAEAAPFLGERLESERLGDWLQTLYLVVVDDHANVVEPVMRGEEYRLPVGSFIALTIAQQNEHAMRRPVQSRRVRHPGPDRQPVTQGSSRELDTRNSLVRHVTTQVRTIAIVCE